MAWTWTLTLVKTLAILIVVTQGVTGLHFDHEQGHYYELDLDGHEMGSSGHGLEDDHEVSESHHGLALEDRGREIPLGDEEPIESDEDDEEAPLHLVSKIDPSTPAISLTAELGYNGAELFFDGSSLSLPRPFTAKSHRFKGGVNWTIYPGRNYTGNPKCLVADPGHHVTSNGNHLVTVGSIRRGCWCNDSMMVTPRPRSQSYISSAVQLWSARNGEGNSVYTDGHETRLPYPFDMGSFQLVGTWIPWTLFGESDLTGDSTCLVADPEGAEGNVNYVFTNIPRPFRISSVQQECVASTAFEFAAEEKGGKILDNEIPVMPGPGVSPGAGSTGGGQGSKAGQKGESETPTKDSTETGKAKAKERNGKAGAGNLKMASHLLLLAPVVLFGRN